MGLFELNIYPRRLKVLKLDKLSLNGPRAIIVVVIFFNKLRVPDGLVFPAIRVDLVTVCYSYRFSDLDAQLYIAADFSPRVDSSADRTPLVFTCSC